MSDDRASVYIEEDGTIVYRASALGSCTRALVAARRGIEEVPFDAKTLGYFHEGNLHEADILARLADEYGYELVPPTIEDGQLKQVEVDLHIAEGIIVRCHFDGEWVITRDNGAAIIGPVEAKSMSDAAYRRWIARRFDEYPGYGWQVSAYMLAMQYADYVPPALYAAKNRDNGEMHVEVLSSLPHTLDEIVDRVMRAESWTDDACLPDCDPEANKWICNYPFLHDGYKESEAPVELSDSVLDELGDALDDAKKQLRAYSALVEELTKLLKKKVVERAGYDRRLVTDHHQFEIKKTYPVRINTAKVRKLLGKGYSEVTEEGEVEYTVAERR